MTKIIPFLEELTENNNREWFIDTKDNYNEARNEFVAFVANLIGAISLHDKQFVGLKPKDCIFRLYRDVRFSKNKLPYKTYFGAYLSQGGRKSIYAGYYIHIEPNGSFLGGGLYRPDGDSIKKVRQQIDYNAQDLRNILAQTDFKKYYGTMRGETLKTAPRDYPKDHPDIDLLKHKDFIATHLFNESILENENAVHYVTERFMALSPFLNYLNSALLFENQEPKIAF